jgi:PhnB protein
VNVAGVIPHLVVHDGLAALEFYQKALGAEVAYQVPSPDGKRLMHASLSINGGGFMLCDDFPEYCGGQARAPKTTGVSGVTMHLNVPDCDAAVARMAEAGGTSVMPPEDMFWGDRYGKVTDPFGHEWSFATRISEERTAAAAKKFEEWQASMAAAPA